MANDGRQMELIPRSTDVAAAADVLERAQPVGLEATGHELIRMHPAYRRAIVKYLRAYARAIEEEG